MNRGPERKRIEDITISPERLTYLRTRQNELWREMEGFERVYFIQEGSANLTQCLRPLIRKFEEQVARLADGNIPDMDSYVIFLEGLPGSGKTYIADKIREVVEITSERMKILKNTEVDFRYVPWEESEDELRYSGGIARRGMAPDTVEDLEIVGAWMTEKVIRPIREGRKNLIILVEKPGGTSVNLEDGLVVSRPYAPTMRRDLIKREGVFQGIQEGRISVASIGVVAGPMMEILGYYRTYVKKLFIDFTEGRFDEDGAIREADRIGRLFGIPEADKIDTLAAMRRVGEGGSVETINRARVAADELIRNLRKRKVLTYPQYLDRVLNNQVLGRKNFFEDLLSSFRSLAEQSEQVAEIMDITTGNPKRDYLEILCKNLVAASVLNLDFKGSDRQVILLNNPDIRVKSIRSLRYYLEQRANRSWR